VSARARCAPELSQEFGASPLAPPPPPPPQHYCPFAAISLMPEHPLSWRASEWTDAGGGRSFRASSTNNRRPNRSAKARREQRCRADARSLHKILAGVTSIHRHRGNKLSHIGLVLQQHFRDTDTTNAALSSVVEDERAVLCQPASTQRLDRDTASLDEITGAITDRFDQLGLELSSVLNQVTTVSMDACTIAITNKIDKLGLELSSVRASDQATTVSMGVGFGAITERFDKLGQELSSVLASDRATTVSMDAFAIAITEKIDKLAPVSMDASFTAITDKIDKLCQDLSSVPASDLATTVSMDASFIAITDKIDKLSQDLSSVFASDFASTASMDSGLNAITDILDKLGQDLSSVLACDHATTASMDAGFIAITRRIDRFSQELSSVLANDLAKLSQQLSTATVSMDHVCIATTASMDAGFIDITRRVDRISQELSSVSANDLVCEKIITRVDTLDRELTSILAGDLGTLKDTANATLVKTDAIEGGLVATKSTLNAISSRLLRLSLPAPQR
jgi:hypothetical protein